MLIKLIAVGKIKEDYWNNAIHEYLKRLKRYHQVNIVEIKDEKDPPTISDASIKQLLTKEAERILSHISPQDYVISLAIQGETYDSISFAKHFQNLDAHGITHVTFIIGGSNGLSEDIIRRSDELLSFSKFTFPHQMMRVIFLEQLYRSSRINSGEPYHK